MERIEATREAWKGAWEEEESVLLRYDRGLARMEELILASEDVERAWRRYQDELKEGEDGLRERGVKVEQMF
jgi:hypothetical protein